MSTNSIPPVLVERADTRPIRLVPLRDTRAEHESEHAPDECTVCPWAKPCDCACHGDVEIRRHDA